MKNNIRHIVEILIALIIIGFSNSYAQKVKVPFDVQFRVIPKILSLNKNLKLQPNETFNSTIIYSETQRNSKNIYDEFKKLTSNNKILLNKNETMYFSLEINELERLRSHIRENKIQMLYLTPVRGIDISEITKICREESVITITAVEEYIINKVAVVLTLEENKVQILINQKAAKEEGANFSSRLLKIAKIIE